MEINTRTETNIEDIQSTSSGAPEWEADKEARRWAPKADPKGLMARAGSIPGGGQ